jgi:hypothetical protein
MTQFQNSTIDVIRNELKSKREMFGRICLYEDQFVRQLSAESNILRTALMSSASVVEVGKTLATLVHQCTKALLHIM